MSSLQSFIIYKEEAFRNNDGWNGNRSLGRKYVEDSDRMAWKEAGEAIRKEPRVKGDQYGGV